MHILEENLFYPPMDDVLTRFRYFFDIKITILFHLWTVKPLSHWKNANFTRVCEVCSTSQPRRTEDETTAHPETSRKRPPARVANDSWLCIEWNGIWDSHKVIQNVNFSRSAHLQRGFYLSKYVCATGLCIFPLDVRMRNGTFVVLIWNLSLCVHASKIVHSVRVSRKTFISTSRYFTVTKYAENISFAKFGF